MAEHRVTKTEGRQYLFELSDGAIDTQRVRCDAGYTVSWLPQLSQRDAGLCWYAAVQMVYTLAATRRRCRRLRLGTLADDTGTTNKTTYRLHFEHSKITLRLYDVYCKVCSKSEQFGDVHEFVLLHQCLYYT